MREALVLGTVPAGCSLFFAGDVKVLKQKHHVELGVGHSDHCYRPEVKIKKLGRGGGESCVSSSSAESTGLCSTSGEVGQGSWSLIVP